MECEAWAEKPVPCFENFETKKRHFLDPYNGTIAFSIILWNGCESSEKGESTVKKLAPSTRLRSLRRNYDLDVLW